MSEIENVERELENLFLDVEESKGERHYARKFKNIYVKSRKALVILNKNRQKTGNQHAYEKAVEFLQGVIDE